MSYDKAAKKLVLRQFHVAGFVESLRSRIGFGEWTHPPFRHGGDREYIAPGFRGRETYRIVSDDEFVETFAMTEPE